MPAIQRHRVAWLLLLLLGAACGGSAVTGAGEGTEASSPDSAAAEGGAPEDGTSGDATSSSGGGANDATTGTADAEAGSAEAPSGDAENAEAQGTDGSDGAPDATTIDASVPQEASDGGPDGTGASVDGGSLDAGAGDSGTMDAGSVDSGSIDSGSIDSGSVDGGSTDTGSADSSSVDGGSTDSGARDAATDAGDSGLDAAADAGIPGPGPPNPGYITCGSTLCDAGTSYCCTTTTPTCVPGITSCPGEWTLGCDEPADCPSGTSCYVGANAPLQTQCVAIPSGPKVCKTNADCGDSGLTCITQSCDSQILGHPNYVSTCGVDGWCTAFP